jgi:hypothetical protein
MVAALRDFVMARCAPVFGFVTLFAAIAYAQTTPGCSCLTGTKLYTNDGGDGRPLRWKFEAYRKNQGEHQLICYVRDVENRSDDAVRDVLWDVAGYRRDGIRAHMALPSCVDYAGEMKSSPVQGPLYHGVTSQAYDTSVRPPEAGWVPRKDASAASDTPPPLMSDFVFDTRGKDGLLQASHVRIESSASFDGKVGFFSFDVTNDGLATVGVFINMPLCAGNVRGRSDRGKALFL